MTFGDYHCLEHTVRRLEVLEIL